MQSGDVSSDSAVIWARADRPARMLAEVATSDSFKTIARAVFVDALPETDLTANALIDGLPAGQDVFYRIRFQDLASPTIVGESVTGRFRTAPGDRRSVSFVWSGDTAGQGWGIDEARGGMRTYATMLRNRPDFFIHNGDTIYADGSIAAEQKMPDGQIWKNLVSEDKAKSAETLAEFRGNYKYNLIDKNVLAFNAEVPIFAQWDDHEVTNNWWPGEPLTRAEHARKKYVESNALVLAARGAARSTNTCRCASPRPRPDVYRKISYGPLLDVFMLDMRSYRGQRRRDRTPTGRSGFLGAGGLAQARAHELAGHLEGDRRRHAARPHRRLRHRSQMGRRGGGAGDGPPRGRELEIADLLSFIKHAGIRNTLWLTADVHYTAAHYYDPDKAVFQDFEPFWEFVSGPLRRQLPAEQTRQYVRAAARLREGAGHAEPAPERGPPILRSRRDRRRDRSHDRDAQGRRRPRAVVEDVERSWGDDLRSRLRRLAHRRQVRRGCGLGRALWSNNKTRSARRAAPRA